MRTRVKDIYNIKRNEFRYSFQMQHNGKWSYLCNDTGYCFYETEAARDAAQAAVRACRTLAQVAALGDDVLLAGACDPKWLGGKRRRAQLGGKA